MDIFFKLNSSPVRLFLLMRQPSIPSFQYFPERVSALKFPLHVAEYYSYNSVPSFESIKLKTIYRDSIGTLSGLYRDSN